MTPSEKSASELGIRVATIGVAQLMASSSTRAKPSQAEDETNTPALLEQPSHVQPVSDKAEELDALRDPKLERQRLQFRSRWSAAGHDERELRQAFQRPDHVGKPLLLLDQPADCQDRPRPGATWLGRHEEPGVNPVRQQDGPASSCACPLQVLLGLAGEYCRLRKEPLLALRQPDVRSPTMIRTDDGERQMLQQDGEARCPEFLRIQDVDAVVRKRPSQRIGVGRIGKAVAQKCPQPTLRHPVQHAVGPSKPSRQREKADAVAVVGVAQHRGGIRKDVKRDLMTQPLQPVREVPGEVVPVGRNIVVPA